MSDAAILKNQSYDDYVRLPGVRVSDLAGFKRSPLHARYAMLHPSDDTPSTIIGTALHTCVLEPKKFLADYAVAPELDKRTKEGKAKWVEFQEAHPNAIVLRDDEYDLVRGMANAIFEHPFVQSLVALPSLREIAVVWDEMLAGGLTRQPCKARVDWVVSAGQTFVIDIKTARDASPDAFAKAIHNLSYHVKAASYLRGLQAAAPVPNPRRFLWLVVENSAPYGVAIYEASEGLLAQGEQEYTQWLGRYSECSLRESWPGYPTPIMPIDLPKWAWKAEEVL